MTDLEPTYFSSPGEFRKWLEKHHLMESALVVGYYKVGTGIASMSWSESVDEALCFGWIDGVRRSVDEQRYSIRFTPRRAGSNWSAVNVAKIEKLTSKGRMHPAGTAAWEAHDLAKTAVYSYEQRKNVTLDQEHEAQLRANPAAWDFFQAQPASYRSAAIFWIGVAKREETRDRRLAELIEDSAAGRRVKPLSRPSGKSSS